MTINPAYPLRSAIISLALTAASHGATTFVTNTSGNAAALAGDNANTTTPLTLSAEDGGGTLNLTTVSVLLDNAESALGMDADTLGVSNDKFGVNNENPQTWIFRFDQTLSFDGVQFIDQNFQTGSQDTMTISSSAWIGNTVTNGSNWSFNSTTGTITTDNVPNSSTSYDFTGAGLANITSGTTITMAFNTGNGGTGLQSFTVSIPEPSTALLAGLFSLTGVMRRRR